MDRPIAGLFAGIMTATLAACGASPAPQTQPEPEPAGKTTTVELVTAQEAKALALSKDQAKAIFGVSDRNGTDSVDAYTVVWDEETEIAWAPAFKDQETVIEQVRRDGQPLAEPVPAGSVDADSMLIVRVSDYTQTEIEAALGLMREAAGKVAVAVMFEYSPANDAIEASAKAALSDLVGDSIGGVRVIHTITEPTDYSRDTWDYAVPADSQGLAVPAVPFHGSFRTVAARAELVEIVVKNGEACPVGRQEGIEDGLLVLPPGSSASESPLSITIGETQIQPGDGFLTTTLSQTVITEGVDCGGKHWDTAYHIPDGETEIWTIPDGKTEI
jgi:hypothetical protein